MIQNVEKRSWKEFRDSKLLWWVNRSLHLFGWTIIYEISSDGSINVYPARTNYRGFSVEVESKNFVELTQYIANNADDLIKDINDLVD